MQIKNAGKLSGLSVISKAAPHWQLRRQGIWPILLSLIVITLPFQSMSVIASNQIEWNPYSKGTAKWLWLDVYEATLFLNKDVASLAPVEQNQALNLQLCYQTEVKASQIVEAAQTTLANQHSKALTKALSDEISRLHQAYENVATGDCYQLQYDGHNKTRLLLNQEVMFTSNNEQFKNVYFNIWLGEQPISNDLRQALLTPMSVNKVRNS